jgi:hypothetical protein
MRKLLIGAALGALFAAPGFAGEPAKVTTEPVKLTPSQMDQVAAGNPCSFAFKSVAICKQSNWTSQTAVAVSGGGIQSGASAANLNSTLQVQGDFNSF